MPSKASIPDGGALEDGDPGENGRVATFVGPIPVDSSKALEASQIEVDLSADPFEEPEFATDRTMIGPIPTAVDAKAKKKDDEEWSHVEDALDNLDQ